MSEKTYTLADLEQARADERARAEPLIKALEVWLDGADCSDWGEDGIDNPAPLSHKPGNKCLVCISKKALDDFHALGPIGETREETERRVRRETFERVRKRVVSQSYLLYDEDGNGYMSMTELDVLQILRSIAEEK